MFIVALLRKKFRAPPSPSKLISPSSTYFYTQKYNKTKSKSKCCNVVFFSFFIYWIGWMNMYMKVIHFGRLMDNKNMLNTNVGWWAVRRWGIGNGNDAFVFTALLLHLIELLNAFSVESLKYVSSLFCYLVTNRNANVQHLKFAVSLDLHRAGFRLFKLPFPWSDFSEFLNLLEAI